MAMVTIDNLKVTRNGRTICAVGHLVINEGARLGVIGDNGSGKTTLLRVIAGLEHRFSGQCELAVPSHQRVYVHQRPYLFRGTVLFNVMYGLRARHVTRSQARRRATAWLQRLGADGLAGESVGHLSGGERRRVALARAMALEPALLLLDEPLAEMDDRGAGRLLEAIEQMEATTVVVASPTPLAERWCRRHVQLKSTTHLPADPVRAT